MNLRWEHWTDALVWFAYNIFGILVPVGSTIIVLIAMRLDITVGDFTNGGQFAIYSAGMWATTIYVITKRTQSRLPRTEVFGLLFYLCIIIAVVLFVLAILSSNGVAIDERVIQWPSIALFSLSAVFTLIAVAFDNSRTEFDFRTAVREGQDALGEDFDKLQD